MQKTTNSNEFIRALKSTFAPEQVRSENGPQFDSVELSYFAKEWGFKHTTSRPRFPQANGDVEPRVRNCEESSNKKQRPAKALLT